MFCCTAFDGSRSLGCGARYHITKVRTSWSEHEDHAYAKDMAHHVTLIACQTPHPEWQDGELLPDCNVWYFCKQDLVGQVVNIKSDEGVPLGKGSAVAVMFLRHFYNQNSYSGQGRSLGDSFGF